MKNMRNGNERRNGKKLETRFTRVMLAVMAMCIWFNSGFYSMASTNYAENAGKWILNQIFWVGLVILALALIGCAMKRAWVAAVITGLCGGIILVFVKNPQMLEAIGQKLVNIVLGS